MAKDAHRHVLPGNLLTGPPIPTEGSGEAPHKHKIVGGEGMTSVNPGVADDNHRHLANGQGTSGPRNTMQDTQLEKGESEVKQLGK